MYVTSASSNELTLSLRNFSNLMTWLRTNMSATRPKIHIENTVIYKIHFENTVIYQIEIAKIWSTDNLTRPVTNASHDFKSLFSVRKPHT